MDEINLASLREVKKTLEKYNLRPQKRWGQNFLIDQNIVNKIMWEARAETGDHIIEIGPGLGVLTVPLASCSEVLAIEKDRGLILFLKEIFDSKPRVTIIEGDVRKLDLSHLICSVWGEIKPVKIVANLPYYLTSFVIYRLLRAESPWIKAVLMVQKEVAHRIVAPPGSRTYGSLSVLCQFFTHVHLAFHVSRHVFYPSPQVDSAVIVMVPRVQREEAGDEKLFFDLVSGVFQQRRKTILNALGNTFNRSTGDVREVLAGAGIDSARRPESLKSEEFANLCRMIYNKKWQNSRS